MGAVKNDVPITPGWCRCVPNAKCRVQSEESRSGSGNGGKEVRDKFPGAEFVFMVLMFEFEFLVFILAEGIRHPTS